MLGVVMSHSCNPSTCEAKQENHKFSSSLGSSLAKTLSQTLKRGLGVGVVAHEVEHLPNMPKALGSISSMRSEGQREGRKYK